MFEMFPVRSALSWVRVVFAICFVVMAGVRCGGGDGASDPGAALTLAPSALTVAAGASVDVKATTARPGSAGVDVTATATWATSNAAIATVAAGKVTGVKAGDATITASIDGLVQTVALTVTAPSLVSLNITPATPTLAKGLTKQLVATGTFTDNSTKNVSAQVVWSSATAATATVSSMGLLTGVAAGTSAISAKLGAISGTTLATITNADVASIAITPPDPTVPVGVTKQFAATATMTDGTTEDLTTQAIWASSTANATVGAATGLAKGVSKGTSSITATFKAIVGTTTITVTNATLVSIGVTPATPSIAKGLKQQFTATGTYSDSTTQNITTLVTWASATVATATISNVAGTNGLATSLAVGTTVISATQGAISNTTTLTVTAAALVSIAVTPATPSIAKGLNQQFVATGTYTDATTQVLTTTATWASATVATATISNAAGSEGLASSVAVGTSVISAKLGAISGNTTLTVTPATLVSIAVTPATPSIAKGLKQQFVATGTYTDATTQIITTTVTWGSATVGTATISNAAGSNGLASSVAIGTSVISATLGGVSGNTTLTVTAATLVSIAVTPANPSVAKGLTQQFVATGTYTDASTQILTTVATWASSDTSKATISNAAGSNGLASTVAVGTSTISAKDPGTGITGTTLLTVAAAKLVSIAVTPANPTIGINGTQPFVATGTYTDASTLDITTTVTWASSDVTKATISNVAGSNGLAKATASPGSTTISATLGVSGSTLLTVTLCVSGTTTINLSGAIVNFTAPAGCTALTITAAGAQGGTAVGGTGQVGGLGASMKGNFVVPAGRLLKVLVGEMPPFNGGGGGTFVVDSVTGAALVAAGGGGGGAGDCCGTQVAGVAAVITPDGTPGAGAGCAGAAGGIGGAADNGLGGVNLGSGGGGGFAFNGGDGANGQPSGNGGASYKNGGAGGTGARLGGFGGGGGASSFPSYINGGGGGGGGWAGGGGTNSCSQWGAGGGGGSVNTGAAQVNAGGVRAGNGQVVISY